MPPRIFIAAEVLGLATVRSGLAPIGDELDALDLAQLPEPRWMLQLDSGIAGLAFLHRRGMRGR